MADQKLTAKLGLDTSEYDSKLNKAQQGAQNFGTGLRSVAGKVSVAFAAIAGAFAVVRKGIDQTEMSSDQWEKTTGLLEGAWQGFWRTVWSGDWDKLISNIRNSAEATRDFKDAADGLKMIFASNTIKKARLEGDLQSAVLGAAETADPAKRKEYFSQAIEAQKSLTQITVSEIQQRLKLNEDFYKKVMGYDDKYSDLMIEKIKEIAGNYEYWFGPDSVALEGLKRSISQAEFKKSAQFRPEDIAKYDQQIFQYKQTLNILEDFKTLENEMGPDKFRDYVMLIGEYFAAIAKGDQDLVMLNRRLTQANKIIGKDAATRNTSFSDIPYADIKHLSPSQGLMPYGPEKIDADIYKLSEMEDALISEQQAVNMLSDAFMELFQGSEDGFRNMIDSMIQGIEQLVAEILAKKLVSLIGDYFGGSGSFVSGIKNIVSNATGSLGGTSSGVSGKSMDYLNVSGEISGRDIKLSNARW